MVREGGKGVHGLEPHTGPGRHGLEAGAAVPPGGSLSTGVPQGLVCLMEKGHSIALVLPSHLVEGALSLLPIRVATDRTGPGAVSSDGVSATWAAGWHGALGFKAD